MNLIIDIGNSSAKVSIYENSVAVSRHVFKELTAEKVAYFIDLNPALEAAIVATTRHADPEIEELLREHLPHVTILSNATPIPIKNLYHTPQTLGMDRLAAAIGAWSIMPDEELLVVDFGTAITVDRVSAAGEFLGGNISPGMTMRFEALNCFTRKLPLCQPTDTPREIGRTTIEAIQSGVIRGICFEIEGYIAENPLAKVFFTGWDAFFFGNRIKKAIFADCELVSKGLDRILQELCRKN